MHVLGLDCDGVDERTHFIRFSTNGVHRNGRVLAEKHGFAMLCTPDEVIVDLPIRHCRVLTSKRFCTRSPWFSTSGGPPGNSILRYDRLVFPNSLLPTPLMHANPATNVDRRAV